MEKKGPRQARRQRHHPSFEMGATAARFALAEEAMQRVELASVVRRSIASMSAEDLDGVVCELETTDETTVHADVQRLSIAIRALLSNAVQAGCNRIWLRMSSMDARARLTIIDDGPGLSAELCTLVLRSGFSLTARAGLGLNTAEAIVRQHHGELHFESTPGEGTRLSIVLPSVPTD